MISCLETSAYRSFNFGDEKLHPPEGLPRPPLEVAEGSYLFSMRLALASLNSSRVMQEHDLPFASFRGDWRPLEDSRREYPGNQVRGTVRLTKDGEVRWTLWSSFQGAERWCSECVQVGGPRSARGAAGFWREG